MWGEAPYSMWGEAPYRMKTPEHMRRITRKLIGPTGATKTANSPPIGSSGDIIRVSGRDDTTLDYRGAGVGRAEW